MKKFHISIDNKRILRIISYIIIGLVIFIIFNLYIKYIYFYSQQGWTKRIDILKNPYKVISVTDSNLTLENGTNLHLPFMKGIPKDNALFKSALENGVEITKDGEVFGLLKVYSTSSYVEKYTHLWRVNLTELAAFVEPCLLDIEKVHVPEQFISDLKIGSEDLRNQTKATISIENRLSWIRKIIKLSEEKKINGIGD